MAAIPQYGITPPLSTALPKEEDNQQSTALIEELRRQGSFESQQDTNKRSVALQSLQKIAEEFVKKVARLRNQPEHIVNSAGAKIFTFGSFRLGVYGPGSDIDTLLVVPNLVERKDFFEYFPDLLRELAPPGAIEDLKPVSEAFVPIIKFEWNGISIDLIIAIMGMSAIPPTLDLLNNQILRGLDETDLRCVNGTRVTDAILDLVPQKSTFRVALRGIKLWAQRRAVYANIMGFPGGVAWAMLVARVCQLYPMAASATIILKFFRLMERWQWPQPVLLKHIESGPLRVRVWNPKIYKGDAFHLMPIITPAYPSMCATHNITNSTKEVIMRELTRAGDITEQIMGGKATWKDLFVKHTFFTHGYKYYLAIVAASSTLEASHLWSGLVESKVRTLVGSLEFHDSIHLAHPFNKGFERYHSCKSAAEVEAVRSGSLKYQIPEMPAVPADEQIVSASEHVNGNTEDKPTIMYTTTYYIGLEMKPNAKSLDLTWQVEEFKNRCTEWDLYKKELKDISSLNVCHTKGTQLPDDVFGPGEVKPTLKKKPTVPTTATTTTNGNNKRVAQDTTNGTQPAKRQQMQ